MNQNMERVLNSLDPKLAGAFGRYHGKNPQVYERFMELTFKMLQTGRSQYSAWAIFNVIRWDHDMSTTGDMFKISNDYIAIYARVFMLDFPEASGFFNTKEMKRIKAVA